MMMKTNDAGLRAGSNRPGMTAWVFTQLMRRIEARDEARQIRSAARALAKLDDHLLRDMGLARTGLEAQLRDRAEVERRSRFGW